MDNNIKCPQCGVDIPLTEALTASLTNQIEDKIRGQYTTLVKQQNDTVQKRLQELEAGQQAIAAKEQALLREKQEFSERVESGVSVRLQQERTSIIAQERTRLQQEQAATTASLMADNVAKDALVETLRKAELDLRKQARENADKAAAAELEATRRMDAERLTIRQEAARLADEAAALKLREKDNLLAQMQDQIEALKRKAETGSQEGQGEAQEDILIETLSRAFPLDAFEEVVKGARGGDIVQVVRNSTGKIAGRILWESKNTKAFSKQWIEKVKADQMRVNAALSVIMTITLPDYITDRGERFGVMEGVWITDLKSTVPLTIALRQGIIEADKQRVVSANQDSLQALLYEYLTSKDAQMRIMAVIDAGNKMTDDLNKERNAMERLWAARQKNIENLTRNFTGFFGAMEGIIGRAALPSIPDPVADLTDGL